MWHVLRCVRISFARSLALSGGSDTSSFQLFAFLGKEPDRPRKVTRCQSSDFEGLRVIRSVRENKGNASREAWASSEGGHIPKVVEEAYERYTAYLIHYLR